MHIITVLRTYLGCSQTKLARMAGITQPDLSEMETRKPYGYPDKYQRLGKVLGVPVDALLKSDFTAVPESFSTGIPPRTTHRLPRPPICFWGGRERSSSFTGNRIACGNGGPLWQSSSCPTIS